jgi:hypothetical protein
MEGGEEPMEGREQPRPKAEAVLLFRFIILI